MAIINEFVKTHYPETSEHIHTDEMKVKTKEEWLWVWNSIDSETKFLLASTVTKTREVQDARNHFKEVKGISDLRPAIITTDGGQFYRRGIKKEFKTMIKQTIHDRSIGFVKNQKAERLHSSQRERLKVIRGVNNEKALNSKMENWKTYYNFVRPHQNLNGKTPAEAEGINLNLRGNKWLSLIRKDKEI